MVWSWLAELPQASVTVQWRVMTLTTWLTQAPLVSASVWVTVPLLQVSAPVGAPLAVVLVSPGHSTLLSAGKLTKVGAVVSLTVMVWSWLAELPQASVTVQWRGGGLCPPVAHTPGGSRCGCVAGPPRAGVGPGG